MRIKILLSVVAVCTASLPIFASATPTLLVNGGGILVGANNVNVDGTLFDVRFATGTCNQLFDRCNDAAFTFKNWSVAYSASRALLAQVFVNGPAGDFDSDPSKILGCENMHQCASIIPYSTRWTFYGTFFSGYMPNNYTTANSDLEIGSISGYENFDTTGWGYNFAIFKPAANAVNSPGPSSIPEPSSIALMGVAVAGLAFARRRTK